MRAALLDRWPALSRLYGIHPWDLPRLSPAEVARYIADLDDIVWSQRS